MKDKPDNFKLYLSIHEVTKLLSNEQHGMLMKAIQSVQFLEADIESIHFDDAMLQLAWSSAKVQIKKQVFGFCNSKKIRYSDMFEGNPKGTCEAPPEGTPVQSQSQPQPESQPESKPESQQGGRANVRANTPPSQRIRTGQYIPKEFKNFMDMKDHLSANLHKYKHLEIEFEDHIWKIGKNGIPYSKTDVDDMPFEQRKRFWLYLINYKHLLEASA